MSGGHRFNKKFNSLDKRGIGGSVHPVNNLKSGNSSQRSVSPPTGSKFSVRNQLRDIFGGLVDNSRNLRKSVENTLHDPVVESDDSDNGGKDGEEMISVKSLLGKDTFTFNGDLDENLGEMLVVRSMLINGESVQQGRPGELTFRISINDDFLLFTQKQRLIAVISRNHEFKSINFSINKRAILIELTNNSGYIYLKYTEDDSNIVSYFLKNKQWNVNTPTRVVNDLLLEKISIIKRKRADLLGKSPSSNDKATSDRLPVLSPDAMYGRTRSSSRISGYSPLLNENGITTKSHSIYDEDLVKPNAVPKLFEVELKYIFTDKKVFSITYSDFKTLYDNDWINDSLIDFFIKYEMDKAVYQKHLFKQSDIYAFNSFFFTKLMSGDEFDDNIDYYGNIKRWLNKLDLMSYPNIIIPINENLHWYCCVIKGLPQLLESALKRKEKLASLNRAGDMNESNYEELDGDNSTLESTSASVALSPEASAKMKKPYQPEIFIFDSLRQKHTNIHFPLKKFIIDYCKDKYDVDIEKNEIRMHSAKVPKQNNFNDCGIHVIYNVRKWLNNSEECERIWRSSHLRSASRLLFIAEERNGMRRELRNILLNLKKKQIIEQTDVAEDKNSCYADDDIEVLEYTPVVSNRSTKLPKLDEEELNDKLETKKASKNSYSEQDEFQGIRTLDPKAKDKYAGNSAQDVKYATSKVPTVKKQQPPIRVENEMLRDSLSGLDLSRTFQEVLNDYFSNDENITDSQLQRVFQLRDEINELDDKQDKDLITRFITSFVGDSNDMKEKEHEKAMRPKDEELVIMHCSDNEELNQSVNGLSLSNTSDSNKYNETPNRKSRKGSITVLPKNQAIIDFKESITNNRDSIEMSSPSDFNALNLKTSSPSREADIELYTGSSQSPSDEQKQSKIQRSQTPNLEISTYSMGSPTTPTSKTTLFGRSSTLKRRKLDNEKHK